MPGDPSCNGCEATIKEKGELHWHCNVCKVDYCDNCFQKVKEKEAESAAFPQLDDPFVIPY